MFTVSKIGELEAKNFKIGMNVIVTRVAAYKENILKWNDKMH